MVKDDSLYIIAIVAVVAVVGLVIMATGSSTTVVAQESLPDMVGEDSSAIAGQAISRASKASSSFKVTAARASQIPSSYGYGDPIPAASVAWPPPKGGECKDLHPHCAPLFGDCLCPDGTSGPDDLNDKEEEVETE